MKIESRIRVLLIIKNIATIIGILGGCWVIFEPFGGIPDTYKPLYAIFCLVVLTGHFFIDQWTNRNPEIFLSANILSKKLTLLGEKTNEIVQDENYYKLLLADWRLDKEIEKFKGMISDTWRLEAKQTYNYLRHICGNILGKLGEKDTYLTLSNLDFWTKDKVEDIDFFDENYEAAEHKVKIKRIILLKESDLENPERFSSLEEIVNRFYQKHQHLSRENQDKIIIHFRILSNRDYETLANPPVPFAIIHNEKETNFLVVKHYNLQNDLTPYLEVNFYTNKNEPKLRVLMHRYNECHEDMAKGKDGCYDIYKMKKEIDNRKSLQARNFS